MIRPGIDFATRDSRVRASSLPGTSSPRDALPKARSMTGSAAAVVPLDDARDGTPNAEGETRTKKGKKDKKERQKRPMKHSL